MFPSIPSAKLTKKASPLSSRPGLFYGQTLNEPKEDLDAERSWYYYLSEISILRSYTRMFRELHSRGEAWWVENISSVIKLVQEIETEINLWYMHILRQDGSLRKLALTMIGLQTYRAQSTGSLEILRMKFLIFFISEASVSKLPPIILWVTTLSIGSNTTPFGYLYFLQQRSVSSSVLL